MTRSCKIAIRATPSLCVSRSLANPELVRGNVARGEFDPDQPVPRLPLRLKVVLGPAVEFGRCAAIAGAAVGSERDQGGGGGARHRHLYRSCGGRTVESEGRREVPLRVDLRLQIGDLLLRGGNGI